MRRAVLALLLVAGSAFAQQPRIDSISPAQGPIAGGTIVAIGGASFAGAAVTLDRAAVTPLSQSDAEIRLQMPRHDNGYAVIAIRNAAGIAYREFLYVPPRLDALPAGFITTIAGVGFYNHVYGRATEAMIHGVGFAFDGGNTYIADNGANSVYLVRGDGTIEPFAGNGDGDFNSASGDGGPAPEASVSYPHNVALDGAGNVYLPDARYLIRKVGADGIIRTIAGTQGKKGFSGDGGPASAARIGYPSWIAADGDDLFFIDDDVRIRRIHLADGTISTFAGDGTPGFAGDGGPATQARFSIPGTDDGGIALDSAGNVYLLDTDNGRIRRIDRKSGIIESAVAVRDARGNAVKLTAMTVDRDGNLYYSPGGSIVKASPGGATIVEYGHRDVQGFSEDGTAAVSASFAQINYLAIDPSGNVAFADSSVGRTRRINVATGRLETIAGMAPAIYAENGPATAAIFNTSAGGDVDVTPSGELLIADTWNYRIRRLDAAGNLTTIAGNGMDGPKNGVPATTTGIVPLAIHADAAGIDVVPFGKVMRIDSAGIAHEITRFIGGPGGICQYSGDGGPAIDAGLCQPWDTARDRDGNLYVADTNNNRIRRIDRATGTIATIAGNGAPSNGFEGYGNGKECGDGGPALDACLNTPYGLVFDGDGNLFVSDNIRTIRKIDPNGIISTFATVAATKLRTDAAGSLFAAGDDRVVRLDRQGSVTTLAGGTARGFGGDGGPARAAALRSFGQSQGVAIDRDGNLFFVDAFNHRVRAIRYGAVLAPVGAAIQATASGTTIRATVFQPDGKPAPSVRVDFTAPATGAACTLSSAFAITDANGTATVSCTPNCNGGTYSVTARPLTAASSASVTFTNVARTCHPRAARH